ncbi:MAG TPA: CvpA family protein [Patescibacteria group bacterium]|nr:CvpA family protein [Patescibacteria group bacterium]
MNFIDLVIILALLFYAFEGAASGFIDSFLDFVSFIISFFAGITFYSFFGKFFYSSFAIPQGFANAIGFFVAAFSVQVFSNFILRSLIGKVLSKVLVRRDFTKTIDRALGASMSVLSGLLLASFLLTMIVTLPISPVIKKSISSSKIAKVLTSNTQHLAATINSVFGGAVNETLSFLTVEPKGNESVSLNFKTSNVSVDKEAEKQMWEIINSERVSRGIKPLEAGSQALVTVARDHCRDMFERGYFSHYTPEGLSPFDRMINAGVVFAAAGENLALAPNVELAMKGLMQSTGHRENILSKDFGRVGVGVVDGGSYGEMFCQEFTN